MRCLCSWDVTPRAGRFGAVAARLARCCPPERGGGCRKLATSTRPEDAAAVTRCRNESERARKNSSRSCRRRLGSCFVQVSHRQLNLTTIRSKEAENWLCKLSS